MDNMFGFEVSDRGCILRFFLSKNNPSVTDVEIPSEYKGKPVIRIGSSAFSRSEYLRSVKLPDKAEDIGIRVFYDCKKLKTVELPHSLKNIGMLAFFGSGLQSVKLPDGLEKIEKSAFHCCFDLKTVDFGKGSPRLEDNIFENCPIISAENVIQGLARSVDITKPFPKGSHFEWDQVLRDDVFPLVLKYDSFALYDKDLIFMNIVRLGLIGLLPLAESAGWEISAECMDRLTDIALNNKSTEMTAWLLDYKNRKIGFGKA